jgi:hypothetical protein
MELQRESGTVRSALASGRSRTEIETLTLTKRTVRDAKGALSAKQIDEMLNISPKTIITRAARGYPPPLACLLDQRWDNAENLVHLVAYLLASRRLQIPHRAFHFRVSEPLLHGAQIDASPQGPCCNVALNL